VSKVADQADSLMQALRLIVQSSQLKNTLTSLELTTSELSSTSTQLKSLMNKDVSQLLNNANAMTADLKLFTENVRTVNLANTVDSLDRTIANIKSLSEKINSTEGSLGLLMNDKQLYINLQDVTNSANNLMLDLKENPKRYVHFSLW
jgi:phospholipid/cholesterol/gamma-HCH transport system substrate-binding protein